MPGLGAAYVTIRGDLAGLKSDLNKAMNQIKGLEGSVDKAASNMTSAFNRVSVAVKGIAAAYALIKSAGIVSDIALAGARYETLGVVMGVVGRNAKYSADQMESNAKSLQNLGISMTISREVTIKAVQAHIQLSDSLKLARIAQDAAVIGNTNSSEALERMMYGIQTAQIEVLKSIGLNVNFENSYKAIAGQLGKTSESLSEAEKLQARLNVVMSAGKDIAGTYEAAMTTAGKQINSFKRYLEDFQVKMGLAFGPATSQLVERATEEMKSFIKEIERPETQSSLKNIADGLANIGSTAITSMGILLKFAQVLGWFASIKKDLEKAQGMDSESLEMAVASMTGEVSIYRGKIDSATKGWELYAQKTKDVLPTTTELVKKSLSEQKKEISAIDEALEQYFSSLDRAEKKYRGWQSEHDKHDAEEISRVDREMWEDEIAAAKAAKKKIEDDAKASLKKQEDDNKHYLERVQDATADTFYDIFKNTEDGWGGLLDRMKDYFIRMLAEMEAQAIAKPIIVPIMQALTSGMSGTDSTAYFASMASGNSANWLNTGSDTLGLLKNGYNSLSSWIGGTSSGSMLGTASQAAAYQSEWAAINAEMGGAAAEASSFASVLKAASPYLMAYAAGSIGYGALADATGLPQGEYSAVGAGVGAVGGMWAGAKAGTALGSYWPGVGNVVGAVVGSILGGVGASFIGGDGNRHMSLLSSPELSYRGEVNYSTGGYDYDAYRNRSITDTSTNPYYGSAFGTLEDATNEAAAKIWASVGETLELFPEDVAAGIRTNLEKLTFSFNEDKSWVLASDKFQEGMTNILTVFTQEIYDGVQPVIQKGFTDYAQSLVNDQTLTGLFDRLSENNILKTSLGDTSIFTADYGMAEGADFDAYMETVSAWLESFGQLESAFKTVDDTVEKILNPLNAFETGIAGIDTQFDSLMSTLYQLGAATTEYTALEEKRAEAIANYTEKYNADIETKLRALRSKWEKTNAVEMIADRYGISAAQATNKDAIAGAYQAFIDDPQALVAVADQFGVTTDQVITDLGALMDAVLEVGEASTLGAQLLALRSKWESTNDMEMLGARYGKSPSDLLDEKAVGSAYMGFLSNPDSLKDVAHQFGITTDQVIADLGSVIDKILELHEAAKGFSVFKMGLTGMSGNDLTLNTLGQKYNWGSNFGSTGKWDYAEIYNTGIKPILEMTFEEFNAFAGSLGMTWQELESDSTTLAGVFTGLSDEAESTRDTFKDLSESIRDQILGMQTSSDNQADVYERLGIQKAALSDMLGGQSISGYLGGLGSVSEQADAIQKIQGLFADQLTLSQEAYERPSSAYQGEYSTVLNGLNELLGFSDIMKSEYQLQYEQADYLRQIVENTSVLSDIPKYAAGGSTGPGGLAILHPDEWVLDADQTQAYLNGSLSPTYPITAVEDDRKYPTSEESASASEGGVVNITINAYGGDSKEVANEVVSLVQSRFPSWTKSGPVRVSIQEAARGK